MLTASGLGCVADDWKSNVSSWTSESLSSLETRLDTSGDRGRTPPSSTRCVSSSGLLSPTAGDRLGRKEGRSFHGGFRHRKHWLDDWCDFWLAGQFRQPCYHFNLHPTHCTIFDWLVSKQISLYAEADRMKLFNEDRFMKTGCQTRTNPGPKVKI